MTGASNWCPFLDPCRYFAKSDWPAASEGDLVKLASANLSWSDHIQKVLVNRGNVAEALILSIGDNEVLASYPPEFKVTNTRT
ncbi:hypothetical protein EON64_07360 [archaeon]|nr:MAG: hypothetical protein EON64_07360 [archaeon]